MQHPVRAARPVFFAPVITGSWGGKREIIAFTITPAAKTSAVPILAAWQLCNDAIGGTQQAVTDVVGIRRCHFRLGEAEQRDLACVRPVETKLASGVK